MKIDNILKNKDDILQLTSFLRKLLNDNDMGIIIWFLNEYKIIKLHDLYDLNTILFNLSDILEVITNHWEMLNEKEN